MERYSALWSEKKGRPFDFGEAANILNESDEKQINVILSAMRQGGWLSADFHPKDARKRIYVLKRPNLAVMEIAAGQYTSYEEFKKAIKLALRKDAAGLTWAQIKERTGLRQTVPNNSWVRLLEKDIKLKRRRVGGRMIWEI
jgi:hypothetical protein